MGDNWAMGLDINTIEDELQLHELIDKCPDIDERKRIRERLKYVMAKHRAEREEKIRLREEDRENALKKRVQEADEQKKRTLAMYDQMAKSSPAGAPKQMNIGIYRNGDDEKEESHVLNGQKELKESETVISKEIIKDENGADGLVGGVNKVDLVEEGLRRRVREAEERKAKTLAAYDKAAKAGPAGTARFVDFDEVNQDDVIAMNRPKMVSTFEMRGGVPSAGAVRLGQSAPASPKAEFVRDPMEAAIRKRQMESDMRKRATLEAYSQAARSRMAGDPVGVYIPEIGDSQPVIYELTKPKSQPSTPQTPTLTMLGRTPPLTAPKPAMPAHMQQQMQRQQQQPFYQPQSQPQPQYQPQPQQQYQQRPASPQQYQQRPQAPASPQPYRSKGPYVPNNIGARPNGNAISITAQSVRSPAPNSQYANSQVVQQRSTTTTTTTKTVQQQQIVDSDEYDSDEYEEEEE